MADNARPDLFTHKGRRFFEDADWDQEARRRSSTGTGTGSEWFVDSGVPAGGIHNIGDFYIDSDDYKVYKKTGAATWTYQGIIIKGPSGATGATGAPGATGATGAQGGFGGDSIAWLYDDTSVDTTVDPTDNLFRMNDNSDLSLVTEISINQQDYISTNVFPWLLSISPGDTIRLFHLTDPQKFMTYIVSSVTDNTTWLKLSVVFVTAFDTTVFPEPGEITVISLAKNGPSVNITLNVVAESRTDGIEISSDTWVDLLAV